MESGAAQGIYWVIFGSHLLWIHPGVTSLTSVEFLTVYIDGLRAEFGVQYPVAKAKTSVTSAVNLAPFLSAEFT